ncbi:glycosyltransferase family 8 protein [Wolfiporia cocos MD-104 SS10]|uniref:glycogenin glucosyltransferase n=1 Tax=Wolfiporia cocos (strain MD-104) TaxID=742152 RepID=A0A2H3JDF4_WOLCO|nr:glycosyltransferase family 8 protein [Wolfiporia cocos MD-104 SS10]
MPPPYAFVSLVTSDHYLPGALAVAAALKDVHPSPPTPPEVEFQTVCLVTPETVDVSTVKFLRRAYDIVIGVELIEQRDDKGLQLLGRPDLSHVLTKLHAFRLTQYSKLIFLDADVLPIRPLSHLFTLPHEFAAVPDVGWPDIFNSGVLAFTPGQDKFSALTGLLQTKGSWDGGDQGLLNEWRGNDWHRLSFTYNTTPTAAYTYAPAYERYGSQIAAIHFIGPNKPWSSISYRAPGIKSAQYAPGAPTTQSAYHYDALVDRWFDVYDRHYRSDAPSARADFEVQRYAAAWNAGLNELGADHPLVGNAPPGGALGLEELRKIATEGMSNFGGSPAGAEARPREGEYHSMPLEGRVDLMRPRREPEPQTQSGDRDLTPKQEEYKQLHSGGGDAPGMHTSPTPGPNEVSSHHAGSSPPSPEDHHNHQHHQHHQHHHHDGQQRHHHHHSEHHQQQPMPEWPHSPANNAHHRQESHRNYNRSSHHHSPPSHSPHHDSPPRPASPPKLSWNPAVEPPPNNPPALNAFPVDTYFPNIWDQTPSKRHDATHQSFAPPLPHAPAPQSAAFFHPPPQTSIPSQLVHRGEYANVTGPATPGGSDAPTPDRTKVHAVFPWEARPRHVPRRVFPASDEPPPGAEYIKEDVPPPPPPPEEGPSPQSTPSVQTPPVQTPLPPIGLPANLAYANAWDNVPSIQKYASRLVRPHQLQHPLQHPLYQSLSVNSPGTRRGSQWAADDEGWKRWEKERERVARAKQDASSMDGDDEDDGNDEDESEEDSKTRRGGRDRSGSGSSHRSRSGSATSPASAKGKQYRMRGVQTIPIETRTQGVQTVIVTPEELPYRRPRSARSSISSGSSRREMIANLALPATLLAPATLREYRTDPDQMGAATPLMNQSLKQIVPFPSTGTPTGLRSPQTLGSPRTYSPPRVRTPPKAPSSPKLSTQKRTTAYDVSTSPQSPSPKGTTPRRLSNTQQQQLGSPRKVGTPQGTPPHKPASPVTGTPPRDMDSPKLSRLFSPALARSSSNETALTSSPSTQGPTTSPETTPIVGVVRKGGRVWDPARGVDVFKRSSEEVLQRFLRMGSFEEDERRQSQVIQPE